MRAIMLLLAENVIVDRQTNKLSVINIIENAKTVGFPLFIPTFVVVTLFEKDSQDASSQTYKCTITLNGKEIMSAPQTLNFGPDSNQSRGIININGLVIPEPGVLKVEVANEAGSLYTHDIKLELIPTAQ